MRSGRRAAAHSERSTADPPATEHSPRASIHTLRRCDPSAPWSSPRFSKATPEFGEHVDTDFMQGVAKIKGRVKFLLDLDRIFGGVAALF